MITYFDLFWNNVPNEEWSHVLPDHALVAVEALKCHLSDTRREESSQSQLQIRLTSLFST